jgi:hypothetical protein
MKKKLALALCLAAIAVPAMLQNLSEEIRECYLRAEQCKRLAEAASTPNEKADYLAMERRWLSMAQSYEFVERLSDFTEPFRRRRGHKAVAARYWPVSEPSGRI